VTRPSIDRTARAAALPKLVNWQGVLRDASDAPLNGSFDMRFRLFDAESAANLILIDSHTAASGGQVSVSGGPSCIDRPFHQA